MKKNISKGRAKKKKSLLNEYSEFEQSSYFVLECPHCTNGFLTETLLKEQRFSIEDEEEIGWTEAEKDNSFRVFCPRCGKKVTGLASEKVTIAIVKTPVYDDTEV